AVAVNVTTAPVGLVGGAVMSAGSCSTGGVVSRTVTVNVCVTGLPWLSVAVQDTVVVPTVKTESSGGLQTSVTGPPGAAPPGTRMGTAEPAALGASTTSGGGRIRSGGVVSGPAAATLSRNTVPCSVPPSPRVVP